MCVLATTHDGDVPIFLRPLDGNSSDKEHLSAVVTEVMAQLREHRCQKSKSKGLRSLTEDTVRRIRRATTTPTFGGLVACRKPPLPRKPQWQPLSDGSGHYVGRTMELPQGKERWVIVRKHVQVQAAQEQMENKVKKTQQEWEKRLWHFSKQVFACEMDAHNAWEKALTGKPSWLMATFTFKEQGQYQHRGRPKKEAAPDHTVWYLVPKREVDQHEMTVLSRKKAAFIVATNILDEQRLSHEQVISTYTEQGGVERGFRFLKDPFFLAFSVFVKKPERGIALSFIMMLCLLVYR